MQSYICSLVVFLSLLSKPLAASALDAEAKGETVVVAALAAAARIFAGSGLADISTFLHRIARTESREGRAPRTFRAGYHGGIWQVDKVGFKETKNVASHPRLRRTLRHINSRMQTEGIKESRWEDVTWEKLRIPLYSAIAARLYLSTIPPAVPNSLAAQAAYWKRFYNTAAGSGREEDFIQANKES